MNTRTPFTIFLSSGVLCALVCLVIWRPLSSRALSLLVSSALWCPLFSVLWCSLVSSRVLCPLVPSVLRVARLFMALEASSLEAPI